MIARNCSNNLETTVTKLLAEYDIDCPIAKEDLYAYGSSVAAAAVANLLDEAKANGKLEAIKAKKASVDDLLGVSAGAGDFSKTAEKARKCALAAWAEYYVGDSAAPADVECRGNSVVQMAMDDIRRAMPKRT